MSSWNWFAFYLRAAWPHSSTFLSCSSSSNTYHFLSFWMSFCSQLHFSFLLVRDRLIHHLRQNCRYHHCCFLRTRFSFCLPFSLRSLPSALFIARKFWYAQTIHPVFFWDPPRMWPFRPDLSTVFSCREVHRAGACILTGVTFLWSCHWFSSWCNH